MKPADKDTAFLASVTRIRGRGIDATWTSHEGGGIELADIWSEKERRRGNAARYMKRAIALADKLAVTLWLDVHPCFYNLDDIRGIPPATVKRWEQLDPQALLNEDLIAWYKRLGFVIHTEADRENPTMVRQPRG